MPAAAAITHLAQSLGREWPAIDRAAEKTEENYTKVLAALNGPLSGTDVDLVIYGSLARKECTTESDVDWTLLIDGQADARHLDTAQTIYSSIESTGLEQPSANGPFGRITISHDLIHHIGGQNDTNHNITKRVLLLLESATIPLSPGHHTSISAYNRVVRGIVTQYITHDSGLCSGKPCLPRFLLNDIVRFWRTMCVDFAYKQKEHGDKKWALRNIKLRLSRKLLYVKGLLMCFSQYCAGGNPATDELRENLVRMVMLTPLELLVNELPGFNIKNEQIGLLLDAYNRFLALVNDAENRKKLEGLKREDVRNDPVFLQGREAGRMFQETLNRIFLEQEGKLKELTLKYAIF